MPEEHKNIMEELEALKAEQLAAIKQSEKKSARAAPDDSAMLGRIYAQLSKNERPEIAIRKSIRYEKVSNTAFFLRIAAGLAAVVMIGLISYNLMQPLSTNTGTYASDLEQLLSQTSASDIYSYLDEIGMPEEEDYLYSLLADNSNQENMNYYEIEWE